EGCVGGGWSGRGRDRRLWRRVVENKRYVAGCRVPHVVRGPIPNGPRPVWSRQRKCRAIRCPCPALDPVLERREPGRRRTAIDRGEGDRCRRGDKYVRR